MAYALRALSFAPRVEKQGGQLVATSAVRVQLMTLGGWRREMTVDPKKQTVTIQSRSFWFVKRRRRIPFRFIKAVTYSYDDAGANSWEWGHESSDLFRVGLRLVDDERLHLFTFWGEGTFSNQGPLPDWMYWPEYALDVSGTQETESRAFVELLCRMMKVTVEPGR